MIVMIIWLDQIWKLDLFCLGDGGGGGGLVCDAADADDHDDNDVCEY